MNTIEVAEHTRIDLRSIEANLRYSDSSRAIRSVSTSLAAIAVSITIVAAFFSAPAFAQQRYQSPRTEYGFPDLQGVWTNATITPLQRPAQYGNDRAHTLDEAKKLERGIADANAASDQPTDVKATIQDLDKNCELRGFGNGASCAYNNFWTDSGTRLIDINGEKRTSIIVDP